MSPRRKIGTQFELTLVLFDFNQIFVLNPNNASDRAVTSEQELMDVDSVFGFVRIKRYLQSMKHLRKSHLKDSEPFICVGLKQDDVIQQFPHEGESKLREVKSLQSDELNWMSSLFASGSVYLNRLPQIMLSHTFFNPGFLAFMHDFGQHCGKSHNIRYDSVGVSKCHSFKFLTF